MGLEWQIHKHQQLLYRLHFFREDIMTIFSETCVVAHTCSPSTLVQGQEDSKVSLGCIARPGLPHRVFVLPSYCSYFEFEIATWPQGGSNWPCCLNSSKQAFRGWRTLCQCLCYIFFCIIWTRIWVSVFSEHGLRYGKASTTVILTKLEFYHQWPEILFSGRVYTSSAMGPRSQKDREQRKASWEGGRLPSREVFGILD